MDVSVTIQQNRFVSPETKIMLDKIAATARILALEAIEKANSGHPGVPTGCAELGALLYSELLQHDPSEPDWLNRDKFVLSAGHGSMFLYAYLHLAGYPVSLEDIKNFRSLGSITPGHPEFGVTPGVETTTGPLGQGLATAVGMAIAQKHQMALYNEQEKIFTHSVVALAGDGCMMEGVAYEAISLAGTLALDNLIVFYDSNAITIDGRTDITFTEDVGKRFEACGWAVETCSGYDYEALTQAYYTAKYQTSKPTLIIARTTIGKGAPHFENTSKAHSGAMGRAEIALVKEAAGFPVTEEFFVPAEVSAHFEKKQAYWKALRCSWQEKYAMVEASIVSRTLDLEEALSLVPTSKVTIGEMVESRTTMNEFLDCVQQKNRGLLGGSADLTSPCLKGMDTYHVFSSTDYTGNFIHYGVREHAMAAIANGIALQTGMKTYCATFLSFVDYLRPALRLSALMDLPVLYILAYDSIYNGEDGPTHQPIEQLASVRAMPNVVVIRPADAQEGIVCARMALQEKSKPVACLTTRQKLECFAKADSEWEEHMETMGAYIVKDSEHEPGYTIVATGSEVATVIHAVAGMSNRDSIRIVSMPCREYFTAREQAVKDHIIPPASKVIVVEAAVEQGWSVLSAEKVIFIGVEGFGTSAPGDIVAKEKKLDVASVQQRLEAVCR